jgi:hypothetical protein
MGEEELCGWRSKSNVLGVGAINKKSLPSKPKQEHEMV